MKEDYDIMTGVYVESEDKIWGKLWQNKLWPKIIIFFWLVLKNIILTGENFKKRKDDRSLLMLPP